MCGSLDIRKSLLNSQSAPHKLWLHWGGHSTSWHWQSVFTLQERKNRGKCFAIRCRTQSGPAPAAQRREKVKDPSRLQHRVSRCYQEIEKEINWIFTRSWTFGWSVVEILIIHNFHPHQGIVDLHMFSCRYENRQSCHVSLDLIWIRVCLVSLIH